MGEDLGRGVRPAELKVGRFFCLIFSSEQD